VKRSLTLFVLALFLAPGTAGAGETRHGSMMIENAWSRATPARNGVAYVTVFNHGDKMDRLTGVESPVAKRVELHTHNMANGVMQMRKVEAIEVHPGEPAVLAPGGNHVMMMGLHAPLREGARFPVTLIFEQAGRITVQVKVGKAGAMGAGTGAGGAGQPHTHGMKQGS